MENKPPLSKAFSQWKLWGGILLGLSVSLFMLFTALNKEQYYSTPGKGKYSWVDKNNDGKVQLDDANEFIEVQIGDYSKNTVSNVVQQINWGPSALFWMGLAMIFVIGRDLFYIIRIRLLTHNSLSWKQGFRVIMLWEFASALSPGVVGGAAVAMFILNGEKIALGRSTAIVVITALFDNLFYVIMIPFIFLFIDQQDLFPSSYDGSYTVQTVFWIGFIVIFSVCLFLFCAIFIYPKLAAIALNGLFSLPVLSRWKNRAIETGNDIVIASKELKGEPYSLWFKVFLATFGSWISRYLVINAILQVFVGFGFKEHILILGKQLILWLFMLISPTPGGSGVAEYAFGGLLSTMSVSALLLAAMAFIWRALSYFPYLFIGSIMLPQWLKNSSRRK